MVSLLLSSFVLVMANVKGLHADLASVQGKMTVSDSASTVIAYWQKMLPNSPMPRAILELLTSTTGHNEYLAKQNTNNIKRIGKSMENKYIGASFLKPRKMGLHSSREAKAKGEKFQLLGETRRVFFWWGPSTKTDDQKSILWWGPSKKRTTRRVFYGGAHKKNDDQKGVFWWGASKSVSTEQGNVQVGRQSHYHVGVSRNIVFLEDALKPGSIITPYILSSATTSGAPLLRRDVADFIPMSTRNFTDILEMFAPMSQAMAVDIWRTLEMCEHLRTIQGEKKACATSVDSMVEFAASVLTKGSTRDLQAFSSPEVPAEGVTSGNRYKVAAVSRTTESNQTMTCHGLSFPYASFMCHAVNPTRVYTVTLESEEMSGSGGAEERMEVLAVCHLETSEFDPLKMPCEVEPGKAPVCHFVSRDSDLWAAAPAVAAAV